MCLTSISYLENSIVVDNCGTVFQFAPNSIYLKTDRFGNIRIYNASNNSVLCRFNFRDLRLEGEAFENVEEATQALDKFFLVCNKVATIEEYNPNEDFRNFCKPYYSPELIQLNTIYVSSNTRRDPSKRRGFDPLNPCSSISEALELGCDKITDFLDFYNTHNSPGLQSVINIEILSSMNPNFETLNVPKCITHLNIYSKLPKREDFDYYNIYLNEIKFLNDTAEDKELSINNLVVNLNVSSLGFVNNGSLKDANYNPSTSQSFVKMPTTGINRLNYFGVQNCLFKLENQIDDEVYNIVNLNTKVARLHFINVKFLRDQGAFAVYPSYVTYKCPPQPTRVPAAVFINVGGLNRNDNIFIIVNFTNKTMVDRINTYVNNSAPEFPDGLNNLNVIEEFQTANQNSFLTTFIQDFITGMQCKGLSYIYMRDCNNVLFTSKDFIKTNGFNFSQLREDSARAYYVLPKALIIFNNHRISFNSYAVNTNMFDISMIIYPVRSKDGFFKNQNAVIIEDDFKFFRHNEQLNIINERLFIYSPARRSVNYMVTNSIYFYNPSIYKPITYNLWHNYYSANNYQCVENLLQNLKTIIS